MARGEGLKESIPVSVLKSSDGLAEDVAHVRALGFEVDDDNDPSPENIPSNDGETSGDPQHCEEEWKWDGICQRKASNSTNFQPSLIGVNGRVLEVITTLEMFLLFFPKVFLQNVILVVTNKNIEGKKVSFGELLTFIGLCFFYVNSIWL